METNVTFPAGNLTLEGLLALTPGATIGAVVCHPHPLYGGEMRNNVVTGLVQAFGRAGIATLRFNFRGVGASQGAHANGIGEIADVEAAVTCLLQRQSFESVVVAGYSFGSMVGLQAGAADDRVDKLIGIALPIARRDASFLETVTKPKLIVSGDRDDHSPLDKLNLLVSRLPDPKKLVTIAGADHFFLGWEDEVGRSAVEFLTG